MRRFTKHSTSFTDKAKRVLVTTGGCVNEIIFNQLIEEFTKDKYGDVIFEFIGCHKSVRSHHSNLNFHAFGSSFDSIVGNCDTAISAAGTTMWDLFANSKLVGITALVDNQAANFDYAIRNEQALEMFHLKTLKLDVEALEYLLFDSSVRQSLYGSISGKYDFNGARRVIEAILHNF